MAQRSQWPWPGTTIQHVAARWIVQKTAEATETIETTVETIKTKENPCMKLANPPSSPSLPTCPPGRAGWQH